MGGAACPKYCNNPKDEINCHVVSSGCSKWTIRISSGFNQGDAMFDFLVIFDIKFLIFLKAILAILTAIVAFLTMQLCDCLGV